MSCSSPTDPAKQVTPCSNHSAPLHIQEHHEQSSLLLNMCLCCTERFTGDLVMVYRAGEVLGPRTSVAHYRIGSVQGFFFSHLFRVGVNETLSGQ